MEERGREGDTGGERGRGEQTGWRDDSRIGRNKVI